MVREVPCMVRPITLSTTDTADLVSGSSREARLAHYQLPPDPISLQLANLHTGAGKALNIGDLPATEKGGRTI